MLGAISPIRNPRRQGRITMGVSSKRTEHEKVPKFFWGVIASQTGFAQGEFMRGTAVITNGDNFSVHNDQRKTIEIILCGLLLRCG